MSKLTDALKGDEEMAELLREGDVLALDPSIGSRSSQLGYATYTAGELQDAGVIEMEDGMTVEDRLAWIAGILTTEFTPVDVLVIEDIPPSFNPKSGRPTRWITANWKKLHEAAGACIASAKADKRVRVHPSTWKKYARGYQKSDVADAVLIGYAAIAESCKLAGVSLPQKYFIEMEDS